MDHGIIHGRQFGARDVHIAAIGGRTGGIIRCRIRFIRIICRRFILFVRYGVSSPSPPDAPASSS